MFDVQHHSNIYGLLTVNCVAVTEKNLSTFLQVLENMTFIGKVLSVLLKHVEIFKQLVEFQNNQFEETLIRIGNVANSLYFFERCF